MHSAYRNSHVHHVGRVNDAIHILNVTSCKMGIDWLSVSLLSITAASKSYWRWSTIALKILLICFYFLNIGTPPKIRAINQWGATGSQLISTGTQWAILAWKRDRRYKARGAFDDLQIRTGPEADGWEQSPDSAHIGRQTQTRGNKQCHTPGSRRPVGRRWCAGSGIEGKCQAKHTSMEARRRCQGVLMQPAWCFSNEDMLYTAEKTRGTQTSGGEAQTITQRIRPTEGIKHKKKKKGRAKHRGWLKTKGVADSLLRLEKTLEKMRSFLRIF